MITTLNKPPALESILARLQKHHTLNLWGKTSGPIRGGKDAKNRDVVDCFFIASCGTYSERTIQTTISSDPPGASIYVDGEYQGIAPLKLRYKIDESKYNYLTPGRVVARWRSGATASRSPKIRTNKSVHTVLLKRPSNVAGLDKDLAYVREREEALEEAECGKKLPVSTLVRLDLMFKAVRKLIADWK